MNRFLKIQQICVSCLLLFCFVINGHAQLKNYTLTAKGDTINGQNQKGEKHGKWVIKVPELRGEPGYEEEGIFKNGKKEGEWRQYTNEGDLIGLENYKGGEKAGKQQYFTYLGDLVREEMWRPYNPEDPYDTIAVYGTQSNEILSYKIVPATPYSVKHGEWKYYDNGGRLIKSEKWEYNRLIVPGAKKEEEPATAKTDPKAKKKEVPKTPEMLEYEKKNSKKKKVKYQDGSIRM